MGSPLLPPIPKLCWKRVHMLVRLHMKLNHHVCSPWTLPEGLTIADLVMPWFVFIIGTSVVLAFSSMQKRGVNRLQLLRKITWRTVVLMMLGFCFLNYSPRDGP
ncbi:hypothetical protein ATANTOWER_008081, partial [Ataeniobius toweri]|nr:hypothetical protein [Ataeniobius toweri]